MPRIAPWHNLLGAAAFGFEAAGFDFPSSPFLDALAALLASRVGVTVPNGPELRPVGV